MSSLPLADQVAVVTGAGRGIGHAIALRLARDGARIAVVSRQESNAQRTADEINAVTPDQVRAVLDKYVKDNAMAIVVVAPAATVKPQLEQFGPVAVEPMPAGGGGAREMMRPTK